MGTGQDIFDFLFGGNFEQVGAGAEDYSTYDPQGWGGQLMDFFNQLQSQPQYKSKYDPQAWMKDFTKNWGTLSGLVDTRTDKLRGDLLSGATREAEMAGRLTADQFAGLGGSGAMGAAIAEAQANPFAKVADTVSQSGFNLLGSLGGQAMGLGSQAQQFGETARQGAWGLNQQTQQTALQALLGGAGNFSSVVAPTYVENEGFLEQLMGLLGAAGGIAGNVAGMVGGAGG